jgi:hypothetical protein
MEDEHADLIEPVVADQLARLTGEGGNAAQITYSVPLPGTFLQSSSLNYRLNGFSMQHARLGAPTLPRPDHTH